MEMPKELELDWEKAMDYGIKWIRGYFTKHKIKTGVIGMSGGGDSTLTAYLLAKAIGHENVTGVVMPEDGVTPDEDVEDAEEVIKSLGTRRVFANITGMVEKFLENDRELLKPENRMAYANIKTRVRMTLLYKEANKNNGIVVGTGDRSEGILGYFTKYGDGGVDIKPLGYLYKTQVRKMLEHISAREGMPVMKRIAGKEPSPRLWKGQTAEDELKADYETVDLVLFYSNDSGKKSNDGQIAKRLKTDKKIIRDIKKREAENMHKSVMPPSPPLDRRLFLHRK